MDEIAEKGYAAHYKYKEPGDNESGLDQWLSKAREILENEDNTDALSFVDDFKLSLYTEEIYVYTPKGKFINLPTGATVLDFAYNIHSEIGNNSIGAKVNHRLVPLSQVLKSGDQVEIITSTRQNPKEEWLNCVVTPKAKSNIREKLKEDRKKRIQLGKTRLAELLQEVNLGSERVDIERLKNFLNLSGSDDLYLRIAEGSIGSEEIKAFYRSTEKEGIFDFLLRPFFRSKHTENNSLEQEIVQKIKENPGSLLLKENINEINYEIAACCQPIPGDDVIGLHTETEKFEIHRTNCKQAILFMSKHGDKIVKAKWKPKEKIGFLCGIKLTSIDKKGLVIELAKVISEDFNLNMRSFQMETNGEISQGTMMVYVFDTHNLNEVIKSLKKVPGVINVIRMVDQDEK